MIELQSIWNSAEEKLKKSKYFHSLDYLDQQIYQISFQNQENVKNNDKLTCFLSGYSSWSLKISDLFSSV